MKKVILQIAAILAMAGTAQAQDKVHWGLKGGMVYNLSEMGVGSAITEAGQVFKGDASSNGFHAGAFMRTYLRPDLYIQLDGGYISSGHDISFEGKEYNFQHNALQANLLLGTRIWNFLRFNGGIAGRYALNDAHRATFGEQHYGYQIGTGIDIGRISFDINYTGSFLRQQGDWRGIPMSYNVSDLQFGIGLRF